MTGAMHPCNPYCGICKPPKEPLLICPACNEENDPELGEFGSCKNCGAALPPRKVPEPIMCQKIDQICARPCESGKRETRNKIVRCIYHTPLENA